MRDSRSGPLQGRVAQDFAPAHIMSIHDDEILGKAYDGVLMRRLLTYLRPYWRQAVVALLAIVWGLPWRWHSPIW